MKSKKFVFLIIISVLLFTSCGSNKINTPELLGKQAFGVLQNLNTKTVADYESGFLSIEELRELGNNDQIVTTEKLRNEMTSMPKEKWTSRIEQDYKDIREKGAEYGINWQTIEYLDFIYEMPSNFGIKICQGKLYFKSADKSYLLRVTAYFDGLQYRLVDLGLLEDQH